MLKGLPLINILNKYSQYFLPGSNPVMWGRGYTRHRVETAAISDLGMVMQKMSIPCLFSAFTKILRIIKK